MKALNPTLFLTLSTAAGVFAATMIGCTSQTEPNGSLATQGTTEGSNGGNGSEVKPGDTPAATNSTLKSQLEEQSAKSREKAPTKMIEMFTAGIETVRSTGIEKSAKQVGDSAIDAELMGWDGNTVKLSELWKEGPVVLMWYRGGWCPYCNLQLRAMQRSLDDIDNAGAKLVVLTPELPEKAKETAKTSGIDMVALHDRDNKLASEYGIMFDLPESIAPIYRDKLKLPSYNGSDKLQLPLAATYVIDQDGKITYAFIDADYKKRAEPADVIEAVELVAKK